MSKAKVANKGADGFLLIQQAVTLRIMDIPTCSMCKLSEEKARSDILKDEKAPCSLTLCRKCIEKNGSKICQHEACKKYVKMHKFRNPFKDKYKRQLDNKFTSEFKIRQEWQEDNKFPELDHDMVNILSSIYYLNKEGYERSKRQVQKLVDDIRADNNKIQGLKDRSLPIYIKQISNKGETGMEACGYEENNFSKGIILIFQAFEEES